VHFDHLVEIVPRNHGISAAALPERMAPDVEAPTLRDLHEPGVPTLRFPCCSSQGSRSGIRMLTSAAAEEYREQ